MYILAKLTLNVFSRMLDSKELGLILKAVDTISNYSK